MNLSLKELLDRLDHWLNEHGGYEANHEFRVLVEAMRRGEIALGSQVRATKYLFEARDPRGNLKWAEECWNLVVTVGLNDALDKHFKGSSYTAAWYVGITTGSDTFAAADTMSSHAGWTECTAYDEATRPALTLGAVSGGSVDNSASKARFTISTNSTVIGGAFVTTNNTKGGSTGTLYGGAAFAAGDKTLDDNDTLDVTVTLTATAS